MKNFLGKSLVVVPTIGITFALWLISRDIKSPGFCPKLFYLPACYFVFISFFLVLIAFFMNGKREKVVFFTGSLSGLLIAGWFSWHQWMETKSCPQLFEVPLCYVSLVTFFFLILFYLLYQKLK